jgi:hypothetical protein
MIDQTGLIMDGFQKLNSATKYPSIETHHVLGERGALTEDVGPFAEYEGPVILTEKVDGTNGRIVLMPGDDYFIGSREELLYAKGDRLANPALGIVDVLKPVAERLQGDGATRETMIQVFYFEVYGHKIGAAAKQYTAEGNTGCRLFDIAYIDPEVLTWGREEIARRRDANFFQQWASEFVLQRAAVQEDLSLTPRLGTVDSAGMPLSVTGMDLWLRQMSESLVPLDCGAQRASEGIVLRAPDREVIAKARVEDYRRTLKRRDQPKGKR